MNDFTETYSILYREIILLSKELTEKSVDFASKLNSMQRLMSQMAELQKKVQCQSQVQIFEQLGKVMTSSGVFV